MKSTNIYKKTNNRGITLIALIITIIVLIILAGVSVNLIMGENGLMQRAKEQKIIQAKAEILQELELAKGTVAIEENGYASLQKYLAHIEENGLNSHRVTNINRMDDNSSEILVDDKYLYTALQKGNDVIINEVGYVEDLYPEISSFIVKDKNTNSITVELTGRRAEEYEFYIKAPNGEYKKLKDEKIDKSKVYEFSTITYTYEKLTSIAEDESYKLKVVANKGNKQASKEIDSSIVAIVPAEGNVTIISLPSDWTNDKITTTVETKLTNFIIQYQIDATSEMILDNSKWINYTEAIISEKNEVIYIRLWDGVNAGEITSQEITKIDKDDPNDANIELSARKVEPTNEVKAQVVLSDNKSGVKVASSKWIWTNSEDKEGLDESSYTGGTFSLNPQEIPLDTSNEGTYYLHVLTVDNAGNKIETVSESVTVKLESIAVIYNVDTGVTYQEKVYKDKTCLSPTTFTPSKSGWTFVGWREDKTASSEVLTSKVMENESITLYAVFKQDVTVTYYNNTTIAAKTTQSKYYNNGNIVNPTFKISQVAKSGWTARGWSTATTGNGAITYADGTNFTISANVTLYGMYEQKVTVTYYNNTTTAAKAYGTKYYNSNGAIVNPTFKISQVAKSGWIARGWGTATTGNAAVIYADGTNFTISLDTTLYGLYYKTVTLSYNGNGATSGSVVSQNGTAYYNSAGNTVNATFTLSANGFAKSGYKFEKWAINSASGAQYSSGGSVSINSNAVMYAIWSASPFYAIQNGNLVNAPNASAWHGGHSGSHGIKESEGIYYYGGNGHTNGNENQNWGSSTGNIATNGCKYVKINPYVYIWASSVLPDPTMQVYGNGTVIASYSKYDFCTYSSSDYSLSCKGKDIIIDISKYSTISVYINASEGDGDVAWVNVGLQNVYLYN